MKRSVVAISTAIVVFSSAINVQTSNAETISSIIVEVHEGALQEGWYRPSFLGINVPREKSSTAQSITDQYLCEDLGNGDCGFGTGKQYGYFGTVVYPLCSIEVDGPCIENLELRQANSAWQSTSFVRNVVAPTRNSEPRIGFPFAGSMSLWNSKTNLHMGGSGDYAIYVASDVAAAPGVPWTYSAIQARIIPFQLEAGKFSEETLGKSTPLKVGEVDYGMRISRPSFKVAGSVWSDRYGKGNKAEWNRETEARLTLRIPASSNGWIGGRITGVDLELSKYSQTLNRLIISGSPIAVSEIKLNIPVSDIPSKLKEVYPIESPPKIAGYFSSGSKHKVAFRVIEALRDYTKDKATQTKTFWGFESVVASDNKCLNDNTRIVGFVSTNALAYTNSAPTFESRRLKYGVGGMHFDEKGVVIRGNYDLVIRSDAARCLYGFSSAPVEASISLIYDGKEESISTSIVKESDGWLFLSAKNFTFSTPTIEIILKQSTPSPTPTPIVSATPTPTASETAAQAPVVVPSPAKSTLVVAAKKTTITCTKGKLVKKVTAVNPKCPAGYKKK